MKKTLLASALMIALSAGTAFGAPINNLDNGQSAIGIHDKDLYIEHKFTDKLTIGLQEHDLYGQYELGKHLRVLAGARDFHEDSEIYAGLGVIAPLSSKVDGYASVAASLESDSNVLQLGANFNVARNVDINLNYRSLMHHASDSNHQTTIGASFKF